MVLIQSPEPDPDADRLLAMTPQELEKEDPFIQEQAHALAWQRASTAAARYYMGHTFRQHMMYGGYVTRISARITQGLTPRPRR